jgi:hypothetical protein
VKLIPERGEPERGEVALEVEVSSLSQASLKALPKVGLYHFSLPTVAFTYVGINFFYAIVCLTVVAG